MKSLQTISRRDSTVRNNMGGTPKLHSSIILLVLLCLAGYKSSAEKILMVPLPVFNSHWMVAASIGQALVNKGHVVTVVVEEDIVEKRRSERPDFTFETFQDDGFGSRLRQFQDDVFRMAESMSASEEFIQHTKAADWAKKHCEHLLGGDDGDLLRRLKTAQYCVVISDPFLRCGTILAANLGIPHVATDPGNNLNDGWFISQMQRLENTYLVVLRNWLYAYIYDDLVRNYVSETDTIHSLTSRTDLWLHQTDTVLNFPRPSMPNIVQVGGLTVRAGIPLSEDLEDFMQSSGDDGVIVVSFGTMVHTMSTERKEMFAAVFAQLRQKVVWRYTGEKPACLGNNTKLMSWLPQNDLLAHSKTRAFVNHAGLNGVYESLYHGVPMVCFPLFGDHPGNAARVVARGLGISLDFSTVTSDQLYKAVLHVLTNSSYRETAARLSRLHRDQPQSPMELAVWWIEHVIKHGGLPHLRARAMELPWYQYYLLDVAAFLFGICSAVLGTLWYSCSFVCRKVCCKRGGKIKSQ
ncbi:UDP-glucuronosyltransferase 2C1-like isoform X2 [Branchiostoma floridae]|uniref:UDP-glucuronosyltransferase 2C1-like isoform X2 n=1 Tax=Branchiostoma floridae TaxID=7739 RepID=A0A9J7MY67_BRAFL|nr:UDP-glucuronosyltransferase 2C1-like isoform X2 [Branchiostoma floridae]